MKQFSVLAAGLLATGIVFAQAGPKPEFEVASVRPSQAAPGNGVNVGLRMDGSQAHIAALTLQDYLAMAFRVKHYQISGPDWIGTTRFDINAKLPAGSNSDQIPEMLQVFLADRFGLKIHREPKELPVYALILGKTPLKLQKSAAPPDGADAKGAVSIAGTGERGRESRSTWAMAPTIRSRTISSRSRK